MRNLNNFYQGKKVFLTGITGFKGSWLALWLLRMGAEVKGYALPPETHPSHFKLLNLSCETVFADIRDANRLERELTIFQPDIVFHLAAQPLVRRSYREPINTYSTNVMGTLHLLEACKNSQPKAIIIITSDKVYENKEWQWPYRESDQLGGYDIYSSSKACTEILTTSFQRSFFPIERYNKSHKSLFATVRAGNVIGGGDWSEDRLIPDAIKAASIGEPVEIRNPLAFRPWQHVLDPLFGYLKLGAELLNGHTKFAQSWNFGPSTESVNSVKHVINSLQNYWPAIQPKFPKQDNQPHEATMLSVDSSKANLELDWKPKWELNQAIEKTANWYRVYHENDMVISEQQLSEYESQINS